MFLVAATLLAGAILAAASALGGRRALRGGWLVAILAMPTWLTMQLGSLQLDLRSVAGLAGLAGLAFGRPDDDEGRTAPFRILPADVVILALVAIQCYSQLRIGQFGPLTGPEIARKWLLPYAVGRVFLASRRDLDRVVPLAAKLLAGLSAYAVLEALIKVNLINKLLGKTYAVLESGEGYRWGLKRAQGTLNHPIFFGMMLVLLFPWAAEATRRAWRGRGPRWWLAVTPALGAAVLVTVSRGAQIASAVTVLATAFFLKPRWRIPMLALALVGGVAAVGGKEIIADALSRWAGESQDEVKIIEINGEEYEYTGTNHRLLLFKAYEDALKNVDAFGYGYEMRGVVLEESLAQRFGSIDDHYILFLLQHGYAAVAAFLILAGLSLLDLGIVAWDARNPTSAFAGALFGAMAAVTISLLTVWFAPDFGTTWLFCAGLASNLRCLPAEVTSPSPLEVAGAEATEPPGRRPKLIPAHAPIRSTKTDGQEPGR